MSSSLEQQHHEYHESDYWRTDTSWTMNEKQLLKAAAQSDRVFSSAAKVVALFFELGHS